MGISRSKLGREVKDEHGVKVPAGEQYVVAATNLIRAAKRIGVQRYCPPIYPPHPLLPHTHTPKMRWAHHCELANAGGGCTRGRVVLTCRCAAVDDAAPSPPPHTHTTTDDVHRRYVYISSGFVTRPKAAIAVMLNNFGGVVLGYHAVVEDIIREEVSTAPCMDYVIVRPVENPP